MEFAYFTKRVYYKDYFLGGIGWIRLYHVDNQGVKRNAKTKPKAKARKKAKSKPKANDLLRLMRWRPAYVRNVDPDDFSRNTYLIRYP